MRKRKNFRGKTKEKKMTGLRVEVYNNNVDSALRTFKRKVKNSNLMLDLKEKQYYKKKSTLRREKINKIRSRIKYQILKEKESKNF